MTSHTANQLAGLKRALGHATCCFLVLCCFVGARASAETPDPQAILQLLRRSETAQNRVLTGTLRSGGKSFPFTLKLEGKIIRYEFRDPEQVLQLRLGEKSSQLEEITKGQQEKITGARFDHPVRGTDLSYEDLALRFLYWPKATLRGEQIMILQKCWIIRVEPPPGESQYCKVDLWITKQNGALMQAEAFGQDGQLERKFKVTSPQKSADGTWMLKEMRIEQMRPGRAADSEPTYLEIDSDH